MILKDTKRALRRHHRKRLLKKRKNFWGYYWQNGEICKIVINTPTPCSCIMCGNERKYYNKKTKKEIIWDKKSKREIDFL